MKNLRARVSKLTGADTEAEDGCLRPDQEAEDQSVLWKIDLETVLCASRHCMQLLCLQRQSGAPPMRLHNPAELEGWLVPIPALGMRPEPQEPPCWLEMFWDVLAMGCTDGVSSSTSLPREEHDSHQLKEFCILCYLVY